jgi:hypothetical protein
MKKEIYSSKLGYYVALITVVLAVLTFGIAIFTPPISGPFCKGMCIDYPYTNILTRFPRDYFWMYPAIILCLIYVILISCIHLHTSKRRKIFSQIGLSFSIISATALILIYFIQLSVIQTSVTKGDTDGISILTQYNPHGLFIAFEEVGYLIMSIVFIILVPAFSNKKKIQKAIRWVFIISFFMTLISFIIISLIYGISREYRFEVVIITVNYFTLIISGILIAQMFKREMRKQLK